MHIGYCSPFSPCKTGIADFSEELLAELKKYVQVTLFSEARPVSKSMQQFPWHPLSDLDKSGIRQQLDLIVYQVGNNAEFHSNIADMLLKYPGVMELHDVGLHHLMAARTIAAGDQAGYLNMVRYCHGEAGLQAVQPFLRGVAAAPWETMGMAMAMNRLLVDHATAIIVHSDLARQMLLAQRISVPIITIPLHSEIFEGDLQAEQASCREQLHLPKDRLIMGSFGMATADKRIPQILRALKHFKEHDNPDFLYCIVGQAAGLQLDALVQELGLQDQVYHTGFVTLADFNRYIKACDFCLNLRYPTRGESSASLHRMLGYGKPLVASAVGTFVEYPDDIVRKVRTDEHEVDDIIQAMKEMSSDKKQLLTLGEKARRYARKHFSLATNARMYASFFEQVCQHTWQPDWTDHLVDVLLELGLTDASYTQHLSSCLSFADIEE